MSNITSYAVLADLHGNLPAFEAVLADIDAHGDVDGLLVAGDMTGGPGQVEILRRLKADGATMILGNWDQRLLNMADGSAPEYYYTASQFALLRWLLRDLSEESIALLRTLPERLTIRPDGAPPIQMVHGSPHHIAEKISLEPPNRLDELLASLSEPVVIFAHTHHQWQARRSNHLALNPGAVSGPHGGPGAQYARLTWDGSQWLAELKRIPYDFSAVRSAYHSSGMLSIRPLPQLFLYTILTGQHIEHDFMRYVFQKMAQVGDQNYSYIPDEVWNGAADTFLIPPYPD